MLPLQDSCCGANYLFSALSKEAGVPAFWWGHRGNPIVTVRSTGSLCTVGGRFPSNNRVVDYHSVEELSFQLLDRRDDSPAGRCGVKHLASVYLGGTRILVLPEE
jgi:hypothetical protein